MTDNELIAEFMGRKYGLNADKNGYLKYDTSWDHLMPVVEKIETLDINGYKFSTEIIGKQCFIESEIRRSGTKMLIFSKTGTSKIDAIYKSVILFITWYNTQKQ